MNSPKLTAVLCLFCILSLTALHLFSETAPRSSTLRIGIDSFPVSVNPVYATNETSQAVVNKVFDSLFFFDPRGNIREQLVEKSQIVTSSNRRGNFKKNSPGKEPEIILELKKRIYFPGGKELDAEDVIQTVRLLQDRRFKYPYLSTVKFIKALDKIDSHRLKITLLHPTATWKKNLTFKILNASEIKDVEPGTFRDMILSGTGPYKIKKVQQPGKILLERNQTGLQPGPGREFQYLEYVVTSYTHLSPLKLINNEIDLCELQPESAAVYYRAGSELWRRRFQVLRFKKYGYTYLVFNMKNALLTKNLKNFFYNFLVNGDFLERFLKGKGERVKSPFLPLSPLVKPVRLPAAPPETPIRLKILCNSESALRKELLLFLREELKPFNILLQPVLLEYHSFLDYLKKGRFDLAISGYTISIDYEISDILSSGGYFNYAQFREPQMDALLIAGSREMEPGKREKIYLEAHRLWQEHLPFIPLFSLYYYIGAGNNIDIPAETYEVVGAVGDFLFNILDWKRK